VPSSPPVLILVECLYVAIVFFIYKISCATYIVHMNTHVNKKIAHAICITLGSILFKLYFVEGIILCHK
jgi:hypothetical protein